MRCFTTLHRGEKFFELSNHLGNVLATVSDQKVQVNARGVVGYYTADVKSMTDYYPFGMGMVGRSYSSAAYRYGFNGKENDNDVKGEGNQQDYGMRISDPRLGRFLSVDPLTKDYPWYTPYQFAGNKPIWALDLDGAEEFFYYDKDGKWAKSQLFSGPYRAEEANMRGYYTAGQMHRMNWVNQQNQNAKAAAESRREAFEAKRRMQMLSNPLTLGYELSPLSSVKPFIGSISQGEYFQAAAILVLGATDFSPIFKTLGKGYAKVATGLADQFTTSQIWKITNNLVRGSLMEAKLASRYIGNGLQWLAEESPFFRTYDFYDPVKKLAVSLKTVNATGNFEFQNILTNIKRLGELKGGTNVQFGKEYIIDKVRIDIAVPKGYDRSVLDQVKKAAEDAKVEIKIFTAN